MAALICHICHVIYTVYEGFVCHIWMPVWTEFGMSIMDNFWWHAFQCVTLEWILELCVLGLAEPLFSRMNHKLCCVGYFLSLSPSTDGPRPAQKEIISLRALILLFLKQLILKVHLVFMAQTTWPLVIVWPYGHCQSWVVLFCNTFLFCWLLSQ